MDTRRHCNVIRHLYDEKTSYRQLKRRCVSVSQWQANSKINRIPGVSWKKISHLKQNFIPKHQSEKFWNLSGIFFKTLEKVARRCSVRKVVLRNFERSATLSKKRLWQRCFPVNFAKCLRAPFLQTTSGGCSSFHITINSSLSLILFDFATFWY